MIGRKTTVEECIDAACVQIMLGMRPNGNFSWRWSLAEVWFRTAENLIRNEAE